MGEKRKMESTPQLEAWEGQFGDRYVERNDYADWKMEPGIKAFERMIGSLDLKSVLEVGSNIGLNLLFINELFKVKDSYNCDRVSIRAASIAFDFIDEFKKNIEKIKNTRQRLTQGLEEVGLYVYPSRANFVFCRYDSREQAENMYAELKARGIFVRYFDLSRLDNGLRITVGTDQQIDTLLKNMKEIGG